MMVFISGGCKNGKSTFAQNVAKAYCENGRLYYIATMIPHDREDEERIKRHLAERDGWGFETVEQGTDIQYALDKMEPEATVLMDSVTALLSNEMFRQDGSFCPDVKEKVADELLTLCRGVRNIVLVSDFIYSDAALYDEWTEAYRCSLAYVDRQLAKAADCVVEVLSGNLVFHKGAVSL